MTIFSEKCYNVYRGGNRFKSEIIPPITETKTHKPTNFTPTKTSISPAFESALRTSQNMYQEEKMFDSVSDFEEDDYETNTENEKISEQEFDTYESYKEDSFINENQSQADDYKESEKASTYQEKSLLDEFKPLIGKIFGNVNSEDLLLISLVILLMGESNESSNDLIIPLLFLILYR